MREMYEGLRAVCAVLKELEPCTRNAPALRLAERHLHLLAQLAADAGEGEGEEQEGNDGGHGPLPLRCPASEEAAHVVQ